PLQPESHADEQEADDTAGDPAGPGHVGYLLPGAGPPRAGQHQAGRAVLQRDPPAPPLARAEPAVLPHVPLGGTDEPGPAARSQGRGRRGRRLLRRGRPDPPAPRQPRPRPRPGLAQPDRRPPCPDAAAAPGPRPAREAVKP